MFGYVFVCMYEYAYMFGHIRACVAVPADLAVLDCYVKLDDAILC